QHDSGAPFSCDAVMSQAEAALQPILSAADRSCRSDMDCTEFAGISCTNHCSKAVVSKSGFAAVQDQLERVDHDVCAPFHEQGCTVFKPPCTSTFSVCVNGTCQYYTGATPPPTCDDIRSTAIGQVQSMIDAADESCVSNDDCVYAPSLSCAYNCGF